MKHVNIIYTDKKEAQLWVTNLLPNEELLGDRFKKRRPVFAEQIV